MPEPAAAVKHAAPAERFAVRGTVAEALAVAVRRLAEASDTPRLDAELLMAKALGVEREVLLLSALDDQTPAGFAPLVARREAGEPVAYIIGRRDFWTIDLEVGPGVLIPRPDSETLIEAALAYFAERGPQSILDLGTGSGALLLAALRQWPDARGEGTDLSERALAVAKANAERLGLASRVRFRRGDWSEGVEGRFDLILCNPPYVASGADLPRDVAGWEPPEALLAGSEGLDAYARIAPLIPSLLAADGLACVEIGLGQDQAVAALFEAQGLNIGFRKDIAGRIRCLLMRH